jgi:hypothetical protein
MGCGARLAASGASCSGRRKKAMLAKLGSSPEEDDPGPGSFRGSDQAR